MDWDRTDWLREPHQSLSDKRLEAVRHVESDFPLKRFETLEQWEAYKKKALKNMRISIGLLPEPEKCPLQARRFDRTEHDGFITEKVMIQSLPDYFVTGNLYWPQNLNAPVPMIVSPHGHWDEGRFEMSDITKIPQRCANFALLGMASFSFDMVGFGDSRQLRHHGYFGYDMELWNESLLGLQVFNCIRALDFVCSLDEADRGRIGCTGASGGGTQTIWLTALDERVKASMPVNMVSTLFQGSCTCEAAPGLHLEISNLEIAAMAAPRPINLIGSTGDWTHDLPEVSFPWLRSIYALYGKEENAGYFFHEGPHNYDSEAQENAYAWFSDRLLGKKLSVKEKEIDFGDMHELKIFPDTEVFPLRSFSHQEFFTLQRQRKAERILRAAETEEGKSVLKSVLLHAIGSNTVTFEAAGRTEEIAGDRCVLKLLLEGSKGAQLPLAAVCKNDGGAVLDGRGVLLLAGANGKKRAFASMEKSGALQRLLDRGFAVASADLFLTGEYHRPYGAAGRDFQKPAYQYCANVYVSTYNYTDAAYRVQDLIGVYSYLVAKAGFVVPVGLGDAAPWVLCALPFLPGLKAFCADVSEFENQSDNFYIERFFLPGFLASGGFQTCRLLSHGREYTWEALLDALEAQTIFGA